MNKTLRITLLLGSLVGATSLAQTTYSGPKVEVNYVHGYVGSDRAQMEALIKKFNDSHPNVLVKG